MSNPREPHPELHKLLEFPPDLHTLHLQCGEYGSTILFHLPSTLRCLHIHNTQSALGVHHLRHLPEKLTSLHIKDEVGEILPIESMIESLPSGLTSLELNSTFTVSARTLQSLPSTLTELDVHTAKDVGADDYDMLPPKLTSLNLHKNFNFAGAGVEPRLPPSLTRVVLPKMWNTDYLAVTIPRSVTSLGVYPPLEPKTIENWPAGLTSLQVSHMSQHANYSPSGLVLNLLPSTLTTLSCPYSFLGLQQVDARFLKWPQNLSELALFHAQRSPLEVFASLPSSLRCLYIGNTQYHGDYIPLLPRKLAWLSLKTPILTEFIPDLPSQLFVLHASILDPSADSVAALPRSLCYFSCSNHQPGWYKSLPPHCIISPFVD
jgi:hypothetical protein